MTPERLAEIQARANQEAGGFAAFSGVYTGQARDDVVTLLAHIRMLEREQAAAVAAAVQEERRAIIAKMRSLSDYADKWSVDHPDQAMAAVAAIGRAKAFAHAAQEVEDRASREASAAVQAALKES